MILGLTGGIGSGKSAASDYLARHDISIVDADIVARQVVEPGQPALAAIAEHFGRHLLLDDGSLDRRALRDIVFRDKSQLKQLEAITHPAIEAEIKRQLTTATSRYRVLASPLLLETQQHRLVDRILLIDAPEALQLERARQRDGSSAAKIQAIMDSQMSRTERRRLSDDIINNDASLEKLHQALYPLHQYYLQLATRND